MPSVYSKYGSLYSFWKLQYIATTFERKHHEVKLGMETHNFAYDFATKPTKESYKLWYEKQKIKINYYAFAKSRKYNVYVEKNLQLLL